MQTGAAASVAAMKLLKQVAPDIRLKSILMLRKLPIDSASAATRYAVTMLSLLLACINVCKFWRHISVLIPDYSEATECEVMRPEGSSWTCQCLMVTPEDRDHRIFFCCMNLAFGLPPWMWCRSMASISPASWLESEKIILIPVTVCWFVPIYS